MSDSKDNKPKLDPQTNEPLTDHEYDGIQELDNDLPRWWLYGFYLTIVFSVGYYVYYEIGDGPDLKTELARDMAAIEMSKALNAPKSTFPEKEKLASHVGNAEKIKAGKAGFDARCASCHGAQGQGLIGPNLTDMFWLNGDGTTAAIAKLIKDGVPAKGMPAWGPVLNENEMYELTAYIRSLKGTNPPNAKVAQGAQTTATE